MVQMDQNQANQRIFDFASETGRQVNRNTMYLSTQGDTGSLEFAVVTPLQKNLAMTARESEQIINMHCEMLDYYLRRPGSMLPLLWMNSKQYCT